MTYIDGADYPLNVPYVKDTITNPVNSAVETLIKLCIQLTGISIFDLELTHRVETIRTESGTAEVTTLSIRERVK